MSLRAKNIYKITDFFQSAYYLFLKRDNMADIDKRGRCIPNPTHYFNPATSKINIRFSSPETYQYRKQKIEAYETRLYYEYLRSKDLGGNTYFFTLTYNDNAMPKYDGRNCFDYEDLRYLLHGGFQKYLLRNYGLNFKYFVGAELGDGKGERGLHNNPHYHILFFTYPDETYHKFIGISEHDFNHLLRVYWQGWDEDPEYDGWHDYRNAKFGIVAPGKYGAIVTGYQALSYVAKYVTKDVGLVKYERDIVGKLRSRFEEEKWEERDDIMVDFWNDFLLPKYNPFDPETGEYVLSDDELLEEYAYLASLWDDPRTIPEKVRAMCVEDSRIMQDWIDYIMFRQDEIVRLTLNEYRNRYCNKCRISQGVGILGLDKIEDLMNPSLPIPTKKGWKDRPISLYYYRKLYQDVVKDANGNNVYVLNELGRQFKLYHLPDQLERLSTRTKANVDVLTPELYEQILKSTLNDTNIDVDYNVLMTTINNKTEIYEDYAKFKTIYEDRFFRVEFPENSYSSYTFPDLDYYSDYSRFLTPAIFEVPYSVTRCRSFREAPEFGYLSYEAHPYFIQNIWVFRCFDLLNDYLFIQGDNVAQKKAERFAEVARFHKKLEIKQRFSSFFN